MTSAEKKKRLTNKPSSARWEDDKTYLQVPLDGAKPGSSQENVKFQRKYEKGFGLKATSSLPAADRNMKIDEVTILMYDGAFTACNYHNDREYSCVIYNKEAKRLTRLPPMFASVLGYNIATDTTICKDNKDRYMGYRPKGKHRVFYVSEKLWLKLKRKDSTILSKAYNRTILAENNAENEFQLGSDFFTVTPLGLYDMTCETHTILWLAHQNFWRFQIVKKLRSTVRPLRLEHTGSEQRKQIANFRGNLIV